MLEIILLIIGIGKAFQRPKLKRVKHEDFPQVDEQKFAEWRETQLRATDVFLWATWGALALKLVLLLALSGSRYSQETGIGITVGILVLWLIGLGIAASVGSEAKRLRIELGISWPEQSPQPGPAPFSAPLAVPVVHVSSKTKMMRLLYILLGIILLFVIGFLLTR
jgi:hypothetical protein